MLNSPVKKSLFVTLLITTLCSVCGAKGCDEQFIDPVTDMVDVDAMFANSKPSKYTYPAPEPAESNKIKSIESRGNDIIFKFGDGSEKVFVSDPFHPERGYKPKY